MKNKEHLQESLSILFARLMSSEDGRWTVVTRTKGKSKRGQKWLLTELAKMAELMQVEVTYQEGPEYRIMKGKARFSQRYDHLIQSKFSRIQQLPRQAGKTHLTQKMINEMIQQNLNVMILNPAPKP